MKNTLLLIVLLQPLWLIAQDSKYFNQSIQPNGNNFTNGISIGKNGANYTIVGETCINTTTRWHPCFMNISQYGNLLQVVENNLIDSISESGMRDLVLTDSTMLGAGFVNDTTTTYSYFALLKKDGAILNKGNVGDTTFVNSCYTACRTHDGGFLIGGECQPGTSGPTHPYLIKLDSAGNKLWDTIYYQYGNSARTWITEIKHSAINNGYYFTATYENAGYNSGNILFSYINEAGDVVKDTIINTAQGEVAGSFVICKDGGFLLGGTQYDNFVVNGKRGLLIKLNANWETEWINDTVRIGGAFVKCLLETADSSFILGGYKKTSPTSYLDACITKINANGNLIWERTYDQSGFDDYAYDMLATNDGGYIACGRTEYYDFAAGISQANLYVLKVNCMGLLTQPQAHFTRTQDALTANFQNLSQYVYPDSIDGGHYIWDFGDGATSTQANPTHTYAQGGAYNVTLTAVVCSDTSTYTEAVGVWATGIARPTQQQNAWVEISPNPAQDAIQIQHHFADNQTGNFCLFSLDGQLLQNLTLVGDGNYTVGTQAMASGVYFYTLEQDGNLLQRNKIIIIK